LVGAKSSFDKTVLENNAQRLLLILMPRSNTVKVIHCLWKEILSQHRIRH